MRVNKKKTAWIQPNQRPQTEPDAIHEAIHDVGKPLFIVDLDGKPGVCSGSPSDIKAASAEKGGFPILGYAPPLYPNALGSSLFKKRHHLGYACLAGAMACGISSVELVKAAGKSKMMGFFGSAGLSLSEVETAVHRLKKEAFDLPWGVNLVFSMGGSEREMKVVELLLDQGICVISAAGYMKLTEPLVYYRIKGIEKNGSGEILCTNRIIAKTSRLEIGRRFLSPPPDPLIQRLLERRRISETQASLARQIPMADDLTVEADSAGHTDNRPALSLMPAMLDLRNALYERYHYPFLPGIGLGGGIATPLAVSAAFSLGAEYVLTGSINQACVEAGTSKKVKEMLCRAGQTDVAMAPSADLFEMGIQVQVLKKGTQFPLRAKKLYDLYRSHDGFDRIPKEQKKEIEETLFQNSFEEEWRQTCKFFETYDPKQLERAAVDPKHQMALVFRSYLGKSARWAIQGDPLRIKDYQIWCGPSMGAFNDWVKGSFLEDPANRSFETVSLNLLFGACVEIRRRYLINSGVQLPPGTGRFTPMPLSEIQKKLDLQTSI